MGAVNTEFAAAAIRSLIDEHTYNWIIGRNLNTRLSDESCIYRAADARDFVRRSTDSDGQEAVDRFNAEELFPVFDLHSTLRSAPLMFKALPWASYVHIVRHPVEQADRWHARGWGIREAEDPLSFDVVVETEFGPVPWYAADWAEAFLALEPMERTVEGVLKLQGEDRAGFESLGDEKDRVLWICFEQLVFETDFTIGQISAFLDAPGLPQMRAMLTAENCPRENDLDTRRRTFDRIASLISADAAERLHRAAKAHEQRWSLPSIVP
jgi:hypothetical protein